MKTVKEIVLNPHASVQLQRVENGNLIYSVIFSPPYEKDVEVMTFSVPPADQLGGTFKLTDSPKFFMRWIRLAIEEKTAQEKVIADAKVEWEKKMLEELP